MTTVASLVIFSLVASTSVLVYADVDNIAKFMGSMKAPPNYSPVTNEADPEVTSALKGTGEDDENFWGNPPHLQHPIVKGVKPLSPYYTPDTVAAYPDLTSSIGEDDDGESLDEFRPHGHHPIVKGGCIANDKKCSCSNAFNPFSGSDCCQGKCDVIVGHGCRCTSKTNVIG